MVYDQARQVLVLFGGAVPETMTALGDTWEYDGNSWTEVEPATSPSPRCLHAMTYDSDRRVMVLVGGLEPTGVTRFSDTWDYDGRNWRLVTPRVAPPPQVRSRLAYDPGRKRSVLFGGTSIAHPALGATWEYDGTTWTEVVYEVGPSPRVSVGFAYDPSRGQTVLHGGDPIGCAAPGETWVYDGVWTQLNILSPPLEDHRLVYDPEHRDLVVIGATQLWQLSGMTWTGSNIDGPVATGFDANIVFDEARGELVTYYGDSPISRCRIGD